jgi:hypothetical protein
MTNHYALSRLQGPDPLLVDFDPFVIQSLDLTRFDTRTTTHLGLTLTAKIMVLTPLGPLPKKM